MANRQITAFIGRAGSGKDYQCQLLEEKGFKRMAFADALRKIACATLGLTWEEIQPYYDELKKNDCITVYTNPRDYYWLNFRQILENLGTQGIRQYSPNFWVECLLVDMDKTADNICISDMRFPNEYDGIRKYCLENGYDFKCIFCDYHSDRYQEHNKHDSAKMSNWFVEHGYKDLQELSVEDIERYKNQV